MYTIGQLIKKFGLSRSTLLYYDAIGLLTPAERSDANYRKYSEEDLKCLEQICNYRKAGLPLDDIRALINCNGQENITILEKQLDALNEEISRLRRRQYYIVQLLKNNKLLEKVRVINKDTFVALLNSMGIDEDASMKFHSEFERVSPVEHQQFLEALGIPELEIREIREHAKTLWKEGDKNVVD